MDDEAGVQVDHNGVRGFGHSFVLLYSRQSKEHSGRLDSEEFARLSPITRYLLFVRLDTSDIFQVKYYQLISRKQSSQ